MCAFCGLNGAGGNPPSVFVFCSFPIFLHSLNLANYYAFQYSIPRSCFVVVAMHNLHECFALMIKCFVGKMLMPQNRVNVCFDTITEWAQYENMLLNTRLEIAVDMEREASRRKRTCYHDERFHLPLN